jgi:MSHA biogenesis protein MshN
MAMAGSRFGAGGRGRRDLDADQMSLINKMLQDLDARGGTQGAAGAPLNVRPVLHDERRAPLLAAGGALLLAALVAGGYYGWRALQRPRAAVVSAPTPITPVKTVLLAPLAKPPVPAIPVPPPEVPPPPEPTSAPEPVVKAPRAHVAKADPGDKDEHIERRKQQRGEKLRLAAEKKADAARAEPPAANNRGLNAQQRAEAEYRRALATLQEGRTGDAIASLEQALQIEPRHEAARQTLVGLLIENKRPDEAARQLQQGLGADPRQPALAMLLARLQIERGWTGIETLQRTLPYATGNAEYHAFLAGALQRQQRHREAAEQYQAALRAMPNNGVWLMGLGMSLQAEKRNPEALEAFQKARAAANLSPELQAFVDRKLQQLSH